MTSSSGICLVSDDSRRFTDDERDALQILARKIGLELSWVSAHQRLVAEHEKLRETALLDPLLGVWTRVALEQAITGQLGAAKRSGDPVALAVIDFVQLHVINDRYGHIVVGDAVLAHFAQTLRSNLRVQDFIGRFGGDELAVLIVDSDLDEARQVIEHLVNVLESSPFREDDIDVPMAVTVGLTVVSPDECDAETAFARALNAVRDARKRRATIQVSDLLSSNGSVRAVRMSSHSRRLAACRLAARWGHVPHSSRNKPWRHGRGLSWRGPWARPACRNQSSSRGPGLRYRARQSVPRRSGDACLPAPMSTWCKSIPSARKVKTSTSSWSWSKVSRYQTSSYGSVSSRSKSRLKPAKKSSKRSPTHWRRFIHSASSIAMSNRQTFFSIASTTVLCS